MRNRVSELRQMLNEWDFIGALDAETNFDEYDCMIEPLLARLADRADSDVMKQWLDAEIVGHLGMSCGQVETAPMAGRLTTWWQSV